MFFPSLVFIFPKAFSRRLGIFFRSAIIVTVLAVLIAPELSAQDNEKKKKTEEKDSSKQAEKKESPPVESTTPIQINISRRTLANFLTDSKALEPYLTADKKPLPFRSAFVIDSPQSNFAAVWDQHSCRIVGVVNLKPVPVAPKSSDSEDGDKKDKSKEKKKGDEKKKESGPPSPYVFIAAGAPPLSAALSSAVKPKYFGFRIVAKRPEFLYSFGKLAIEESIWIDPSGKKLKQQFRIGNLAADAAVKLSFSEDWRKRITSETGKWKGNTLTIQKEKASEFVLTYRLTDKE